MKKMYLIALTLLFSPLVMAQEPEVPLFNDSVPNLGRNAKPLDSIVLTPSPLPAVRLSLGEETKYQSQGGSDNQSKVMSKTKTETMINTRTVPVKIERELSNTTASDLAAKLQAEIKRSRSEKETKSQIEVKTDVIEKTEAKPVEKNEQTVPGLEGLLAKLHDVYTFDISGFMLGMTPEEVADIASETGFRIIKGERGIPIFRTSFYEQKCRDAHIYRPEQIQRCIINQASEDEVYYVSSLTMAKKNTKEYIQILFTSPATDNLSYKIYYENKGDNSLNFTRRNLAKKQRRKEAFWNLMFETYGLPDDNENLIWGDPNKAYMQATMQGSNYNAYIVMEDKDLFDRDYFDAEDQAKDFNYSHSFTFAPTEE